MTDVVSNRVYWCCPH